MEKCIESILPGGEDVEIIIVNDGSFKDNTAEIADAYAAKYPTIIKAVHQVNGGHGQAVNTGLKNATGKYFKVVDSDDCVDLDAYMQILDKLRELEEQGESVDMFLSNFVYDKEGAKHKKVMRPSGLPKDRIFGWNEVGSVRKGHYVLMHSVIYRTQLLRDCKLELPQHTFYVDNIYVYKPMVRVKKMYYLNVNFYKYFIGRNDQSVNETVMISRIDQQLKVNRIMVSDVNLWKVGNHKCRQYLFNYLEIITTVSSILALKSGTPENLQKKAELWDFIKETDPKVYMHLRYGIFGILAHLPGEPGRKICVALYTIAQKVVGFN